MHLALGAGRPRTRAAMTIMEFVRLLDLGAQVVEGSMENLCVQWVLVQLADGRRLLVVERTYREGSTAIVDPSDEEVTRYRVDPLTAWNSPRGEDEEILKLGTSR